MPWVKVTRRTRRGKMVYTVGRHEVSAGWAAAHVDGVYIVLTNDAAWPEHDVEQASADYERRWRAAIARAEDPATVPVPDTLLWAARQALGL